MELSQQAYWNRDEAVQHFAHPLRLDWLASLPRDARILDYGCGWGRALQTLHEEGWRDLVGVDFSEAMIRQGRQRLPHLDLRRIDALPLDEPDGAFDAALLIAVLTCIPADADQQALIAELRRLLKPGGLIFISDYPLQTDARNQARYAASRQGVFGVWEREDGGVFRHHDPTWLKGLLADFDLIACEELDSVTMGGNPARILQLLGRK
jgi:ubiquinone/menaquinone biosynthesis C-methylase UbiE